MSAPCISTALDSAINGTCTSQTIGIEKEAILIPMSLIDKSTLAYDSGTVIVNTFELLSGNGVKVTVNGDMPFKEFKIDGSMGDYVQLFETAFGFPILDNSPAASKQIMQLGNDRYVAIVTFVGYEAAKKNKYGIIGLNRGLVFETSATAYDNAENPGTQIMLKETAGRVHLHYLWASAGEAATDAIVAGLLPA
mgnify:CR=1 FL=1